MEGVRGKTFERIHCEQTPFSGTGDILSKLVIDTPREGGITHFWLSGVSEKGFM